MSVVPTRAGSVLLMAFSLVSAVSADNGLSPLTHGMTAIPPGTPAPPLRLPDLDEEIVDVHDLRGDVVVANFWATWCPPCRREMPSLERLQRLMTIEGVTVVAVNVGEDTDTVFSFLGMVEPSPNFPLLLDKDATSLAAWAVKGLPTTYVAAPDGSIAYRAVGGREFDHPQIVEQLRALQSARPDH